MADQKFNEELCEQVRKGKLAVHNTDIDGITELVRHIFPGRIAPTGKHSYYWATESGEDWLCGYPIDTMPSRPVLDFFLSAEPPTPVNKSEGEGIEKEAVQLVEKFKPFAHGYEIASSRQLLQNAKQCALIHCDLMIKEFQQLQFHDELHKNFFLVDGINDYVQLKEAINKL